MPSSRGIVRATSLDSSILVSSRASIKGADAAKINPIPMGAGADPHAVSAGTPRVPRVTAPPEAIALRWRDVDHQHRRIRTAGAGCSARTAARRRSRRDVDLSTEAPTPSSGLSSHATPRGDDFVFQTPGGAPIDEARLPTARVAFRRSTLSASRRAPSTAAVPTFRCSSPLARSRSSCAGRQRERASR